jgi:hypothetical protein
MMNAEPAPGVIEDPGAPDAAIHHIVSAGARGALLLAGISVAVVIGLWFLFYFLIFVPRAAGA